MKYEEPCDLSIIDAANRYESGELTVLEMITSCLERIDAVEEQIQAWAYLDREGAVKTAKLLDLERARGENRGPLYGIPVGIKDIFDVAGQPTKAGSKFLDYTPSSDADAVRRLREAGAVILGKTHTTEFAYFHPAVTRNPWNTGHTPGGSSSGSAAAVAAGMCLAAIGTQTLGSVLRPAAYNGIVGLKPQFGRISRRGLIPVSWALDHVGIFGKSVREVNFVLKILGGYDPQDDFSLRDRIPEFNPDDLTGYRPVIGLIEAYFSAQTDDEIRQHTELAVDKLRKAGATVKRLTPGIDFSELVAHGNRVMAVEAAAYHRTMFQEHEGQYGQQTKNLIREGLNCSATQYSESLRYLLRQRHHAAELFSGVDCCLTPAAAGAAPYGLDSTGSPAVHAPWTILGVPSISLPTGLNGQGLPLGIQFAAPPLAENRLLTVAAWSEQIIPFQECPPRIR